MDFVGVGEAIAGILVGGGAVFMTMRKKLSADSVDMARNQLEIDMMRELKAQAREARQEAKTAERERVEAILQVESLKAQISTLTQQIQMLRDEISSVKERGGFCDACPNKKHN